MVNNIKLNMDIDRIRQKLEIDKYHTISFPEILCQKIIETNISRWIAFLLDPLQYKYARQIVNMLIKKTGHPDCMSDNIKVYNECYLDIESTIDVYLTTPEYIIGIEVKINASETGGDQTERYHEEIKKRCQEEKKEPVEIYLKPSSNTNKHKCPEFIEITFKDILPELHSLLESLPASREHFLLEEFITYIENGPEKARFLSLLSQEQRTELDRYHKLLYKDMSDYFAAHKYIQFNNRKYEVYSHTGVGFIKLKREKSADWQCINFHYEILWTESHYLALNKKVEVAVHLEMYQKSKRKELDKFFKTVKYDRRTLFSRVIDVDFTSIEESHKTMDKIIEILDSDEVVQLSNTADKCAKMFSE